MVKRPTDVGEKREDPVSYSTISSWALLVARALDGQGQDSNRIFREVGLDPGKLANPDARFPYEGMTRLWKRAAQVTHDPYFGIHVVHYWHPTSLHALGYSWMASDSLHDALRRMTRYMRIVSTVANATLQESNDAFVLRFAPATAARGTDPAHEALDAAFAALVYMCRTSYGEDFNPLRIATVRPRFTDPGPYLAYFRAPVEFSARENLIEFDKATIEKSLPTANPQLARVNDAVITEYLARYDRSSTAMRVRAVLTERLSSGRVSQRAVASALHMSLRTLQRKLEEEGTSYKTLLEETRRELARQYLRQQSISVNEVTYLLGFSEPSNFARAFKRWTGFSPSEFRSAA